MQNIYVEALNVDFAKVDMVMERKNNLFAGFLANPDRYGGVDYYFVVPTAGVFMYQRLTSHLNGFTLITLIVSFVPPLATEMPTNFRAPTCCCMAGRI